MSVTLRNGRVAKSQKRGAEHTTGIATIVTARRLAFNELAQLLQLDERGYPAAEAAVPFEEIERLGFVDEWQEAQKYVAPFVNFAGKPSESSAARTARNLKFRCICERKLAAAS